MSAAMSDYREKAEECVRAAQKMRNAAERIEMLGIARNYIALADHAGRRQVNSPKTKRPSPSQALDSVQTAPCRWLTTVPGPGADAAQTDHLHVRMALRGTSDRYRTCL